MSTNRYFPNVKVTIPIASAVLSLLAIAAAGANDLSAFPIPGSNDRSTNLLENASNATDRSPATPGVTVSQTLLAQSNLNNIPVELETQNRTFSTLATALQVTGLNNTLARGGPFTIFAPTDEAFAILERNQPGTLESLFQPENRALLTRVLLYHVVSGKADTFSMSPGTRWTVETLAEENVVVQVNRSFDVFVSGTSGAIGAPARVILVDIPASNGVIHGIDSVLIPPN